MSRKVDKELLDACREGKIHDVERLIKEGANVCLKYGIWKQTPLHLAAERGHEPVVSALLCHGADCNVANKLEETPLHWAVENGHEPVVSALLSHGADPNLADNEGQTPLYWVAWNGHEPVLSILLSHGADCNAVDKLGQTPLHWAVEKGHEPVVSALLSHGADCDVADNEGQTLLHMAIKKEYEPVVSALLSHGADCNVADKRGETPLHLAARNGHEPVVLALLSHGADPNVANNEGKTPHYLAATKGNESVVSVLLSHGVDCNKASKWGATPLYSADRHGHKPVVSALLSHGADPNGIEKYEFQHACEKGKLDDVERLIKEGADVNVKSTFYSNDESEPFHYRPGLSAFLSKEGGLNITDKKRRTLLHFAAENGLRLVVSALLSNGADPNIASENGRTPLHLAAENSHETVVSALLLKGGDPNVADNDRRTPLYLAAKNCNGPIVSALLSNGANPIMADKLDNTPYDVCRDYTIKEMLKDAKQYPRELQYLSVQGEKSFANTLKSGYYHSRVGKLMCVGPEGVGKTAIVSVLRNVTPNETRIPTDGIDLHTYKAAINTEKMEWVPLELKAKDVAIRDILLQPKQNEQVLHTKNDDDTYLSHDSEVLTNKQVDEGGVKDLLPDYDSEVLTNIQAAEGASGVSDVGSRKVEIIKDVPQNQDIIQKGFIEKEVKQRINRPKKVTFNSVQQFKEQKQMRSTKTMFFKELRESAKGMRRLLERALAPVNMMDFGGQAAFYSTHQSFLTYRGLYILVLDGSKDFDEIIDTDDFIPGRHGKPTSREFTSFWVSSIQAYSKGGSRYFPKILVVCTHRDKVNPSSEADKKAEKIFLEIEKMFSNTPAEKHLILNPRIFLNAMDPNDPGYNTLKEVLVQQMCSQPSWGEKLPKAWIPLKMIINQKAEEGVMIMSLDELQTVNEQNPVQKLSEEELATFLKIHHAQGEIIHFPIRELKDYIIISPEFLVAALRSLVTDKRFCKGRRLTALESMNQSGVLCDSEIEYIWEGEERFMQHKQYLLSLLSHLDIIATPRNYRPDGSLQESDTHYVPCLVRGVVDISELDINFERRSIGISFKFESKILPPAIGYRLMASCIDMYPIQRYKKGSMLFSGIVMLSVNRRIDLLVILRSDRIDFFLIHEKSKDDIPKPIAISILDCLKDILVNILESYRKTSSEGKYILSVPFQVEFPCNKVSSPCYDTDRTKGSPTCKHGHTLSLGEKDKWFMNTRKELIKTAARTECPSVGLPPFELKGKPTDRLLADMSIQMMEEEMRNLVVQLGLKHYEIDSIMADNRGDLMNIKFLLLRKWKQKTNGGSIEELVKAAENEGISFERIHEMNRDKPVPEGINESDENLNDEILDSVANKVINESLLFSVYLGLDPLFWIKLRKKRYDIYEINREVLEKWRQSGDYKMKNLVQALCNVDNIYALSLDS